MTQEEKRQSTRVLRHAREAQGEMFEMIEELVLASQGIQPEHDWLTTQDHVLRIESRIGIMLSLVCNIQDSLKETREKEES